MHHYFRYLLGETYYFIENYLFGDTNFLSLSVY